MDERHDILLRQVEKTEVVAGPSTPDLLRDLVRAVDELFTPAADGAGKWLLGKGEAELAKAAEIKARVVTTIASIDHERQKLLQERQAAIKAREVERRRDQQAYLKQMYELRTARVMAVVDRLIKLREMGIEVELKAVTGVLLRAAREGIREETL